MYMYENVLHIKIHLTIDSLTFKTYYICNLLYMVGHAVRIKAWILFSFQVYFCINFMDLVEDFADT